MWWGGWHLVYSPAPVPAPIRLCADSAWVNGQVTSLGLSFPICKMKSWDKAHDFINKHKHQRRKEHRDSVCSRHARASQVETLPEILQSHSPTWLQARLFPPFRKADLSHAGLCIPDLLFFFLVHFSSVVLSVQSFFFFFFIENRHFILFVQGTNLKIQILQYVDIKD